MNNDLKSVWQEIAVDPTYEHLHGLAKAHLAKLEGDYRTLPVEPVVTINSYFGLFASPPDWNETCQIGDSDPVERATAPERINRKIVDLLDILKDHGRNIVVFDEYALSKKPILSKLFSDKDWEVIPAHERTSYLFEKALGGSASYGYVARGVLFPVNEINLSDVTTDSVVDKQRLIATHVTTTSPFEISRR